jgi:competence protein ComEC
VARSVAAWPGAAQAAAPMPAWGLAVTAFGMLWLCLWRTGWRILGVPVIALGLGSAALVPAPDILVSGDARIIALRTEAAGVFVQRLLGGSGFTRETMLRGWAETAGAPFPREGEAAGGAVACTPVACTLRPRPDGAVAVLVREGAGGTDRREAIEAACDGRAAVVVAAEPLRARCRGVAAIDRFDVWRNGPHAVWLAGAGQAARVVSDRAWRGERPWVPPVPRPRARTQGAEPQARIDEAAEAPAAPR